MYVTAVVGNLSLKQNSQIRYEMETVFKATAREVDTLQSHSRVLRAGLDAARAAGRRQPTSTNNERAVRQPSRLHATGSFLAVPDITRYRRV